MRDSFQRFPLHDCPSCNCLRHVADFAQLALIPTPGTHVSTGDIWLAYLNWAHAQPAIPTYLTRGTLTRRLGQVYNIQKGLLRDHQLPS